MARNSLSASPIYSISAAPKADVLNIVTGDSQPYLISIGTSFFWHSRAFLRICMQNFLGVFFGAQ